jgi:hypothetical protein
MHLHEKTAQWKGCDGNVDFALLDTHDVSGIYYGKATEPHFSPGKRKFPSQGP